MYPSTIPVCRPMKTPEICVRICVACIGSGMSVPPPLSLLASGSMTKRNVSMFDSTHCARVTVRTSATEPAVSPENSSASTAAARVIASSSCCCASGSLAGSSYVASATPT